MEGVFRSFRREKKFALQADSQRFRCPPPQTGVGLAPPVCSPKERAGALPHRLPDTTDATAAMPGQKWIKCRLSVGPRPSSVSIESSRLPATTGPAHSGAGLFCLALVRECAAKPTSRACVGHKQIRRSTRDMSRGQRRASRTSSRHQSTLAEEPLQSIRAQPRLLRVAQLRVHHGDQRLSEAATARSARRRPRP